MNYTLLKDRILRYDGVNIVSPDNVEDLLLSGVEPQNIISTDINADIEKFNLLSDIPIIIYSEDIELKLDYSWKIPQEYLDINLETYFNIFILLMY
jgi:hypothetical protein